MATDRFTVKLTCPDCKTPLPEFALSNVRAHNDLICCPSCGFSFGHYLDMQRKAKDWLCDRFASRPLRRNLVRSAAYSLGRRKIMATHKAKQQLPKGIPEAKIIGLAERDGYTGYLELQVSTADQPQKAWLALDDLTKFGLTGPGAAADIRRIARGNLSSSRLQQNQIDEAQVQTKLLFEIRDLIESSQKQSQ